MIMQITTPVIINNIRRLMTPTTFRTYISVVAVVSVVVAFVVSVLLLLLLNVIRWQPEVKDIQV